MIARLIIQEHLTITRLYASKNTKKAITNKTEATITELWRVQCLAFQMNRIL
jgi:hypothetical protein